MIVVSESDDDGDDASNQRSMAVSRHSTIFSNVSLYEGCTPATVAVHTNSRAVHTYFTISLFFFIFSDLALTLLITCMSLFPFRFISKFFKQENRLDVLIMHSFLFCWFQFGPFFRLTHELYHVLFCWPRTNMPVQHNTA